MTDINWDHMQDRVIHTLQDLIRFDTTNPPGNETPLVAYIQDRLAAEGIDSNLFESAPGRGSVVARLRGNGTEGPLLLLSHVDVVAAEAAKWRYAPFSGDLAEGCVWGRGASDMKGLTAIQLELMLLIHRLGLPLKRDIILAATADEESGGTYGVKWLVDNHYDLIEAEYAINEGGGLGMKIGGRWVFTCQIAQKGICWVKLTAQGKPGHGSMPPSQSAVGTLAAAVDRLSRIPMPRHQVPIVEAHIHALSQVLPPPLNQHILTLLSQDNAPEELAQLDHAIVSRLRASLRNTAVPTILRAGEKTNVIPSIAEAEVDGPLLPGQTVEDFLSELKAIVGDAVEMEVLQTFPGVETSHNTALFEAASKGLRKFEPDSLIVPSMSTGFTDSRYLIEKGCKVCGFWPMKDMPNETSHWSLIHGHNERISVDNLRFGMDVLWEVILQLCTH